MTQYLILLFISFFSLSSVLGNVEPKASIVEATSSQSVGLSATPTPELSPSLTPEVSVEKKEPIISLAEVCTSQFKKFPGKFENDLLTKVCNKVLVEESCKSTEGVPIFHYNKKGTEKEPQNILVFSLIHGDETPAGSVVRFWMERLEKIEPRNNWRVVPILNPDGLKYKTRVNANKVDINRNFPTKDWTEKALSYWRKDTNSNPRRFPGIAAASEPETNCALKHIQDFKPDFIVSIHTPLKVLDFDGPKIKPPKFDYLPWKSLGNFPGSLGRLMWLEQNIPVLTLEAKEDFPTNSKPWIQLQDIIGYLVSLESKNKNTIKK